jgi:chromosome segregation ATPase
MSDIDDLLEHLREELEDIWESVEFVRDEAKVQANLARAEIKDEWSELEEKFSEYKKKMNLVREEVARDNDEIYDAARMLGKELLNSYGRIKGILAA